MSEYVLSSDLFNKFDLLILLHYVMSLDFTQM